MTVSGGKLTTFRLIALDVLKAASQYLPGFDADDFGADIFTPSVIQHPSFLGLPSYLQKRLQGHYGMDANTLLEQANECARDNEFDVIPGALAMWAELRWSARNEAVVHLDDLLLRRTRVGLLVEQGGLIFEQKIKQICCEELKWTDDQWQQERDRYQGIWNKYYSVPA